MKVLNPMLVFYKYLLLYFCFLKFLKFLWEHIQLQSRQNVLYIYIYCIITIGIKKLSNEFLLIYAHQDLLHIPHTLF